MYARILEGVQIKPNTLFNLFCMSILFPVYNCLWPSPDLRMLGNYVFCVRFYVKIYTVSLNLPSKP